MPQEYHTPRPFILHIILSNEQHDKLRRSGLTRYNWFSPFTRTGVTIGKPTFSDIEFDRLLQTGDGAATGIVSAQMASPEETNSRNQGSPSGPSSPVS